MALKTAKAPSPPERAATDTDIETMIADELLQDIDWSKVRSHLISKVRSHFLTFILGSGERTIPTLPPEYQLLGGQDDE